MKFPVFFGAVALAATLAGAANAQVVSTVNYVLDATDPVMSDHYHDGCSLHAVPDFYELQTLTVTTTGAYTVTDLFSANDASMAILNGPFVPGSPADNCIFSTDDGDIANLTAGTYTLVLTTLGDGAGTYAYSFNGPAAVTFTPFAAPATVPTLSEWAMILFGALLLAGGGWMVQRRRLA